MVDLAPRCFDEFIGQEPLKRRLLTHIRAAEKLHQHLEPVLLAGASGYGKSTVAQMIATELIEPMMTVTLPFNKADLHELRDYAGIVFIDEIHGGSKQDMNELLTLLLDGYLRTRRDSRIIEPEWVTVIGATTEPGIIRQRCEPLYNRFRIRPTFSEYSDEEVSQIVQGMASRQGLKLEAEYALELAKAAGGVPRLAGDLILACIALTVEGGGPLATVPEVLRLCQVEADGLTDWHARYLRVLYDHEVLGVDGIRQTLGWGEPDVLSTERLLLTLGMVRRTPSGRVLTDVGHRRVKELNRKGQS